MLQFESESEVPIDFRGIIYLALIMDLRVQLLREYGAMFYIMIETRRYHSLPTYVNHPLTRRVLYRIDLDTSRQPLSSKESSVSLETRCCFRGSQGPGTGRTSVTNRLGIRGPMPVPHVRHRPETNPDLDRA